jgi:hypothetical protein
MIFNAIRNIFVKNKKTVNMRILQRLCLEEGQWLVPSSQYSANRKMYFLFFFYSSSITVLGGP